MRSVADLVSYLNDFFAPELWRAAGNLLGNFTASQLAEELDGLPLVSGLGEPRIDFDQPPGFVLVNNSRVRVRVPAVGGHRVEGEVLIDDPLPDSSLSAEFSFELVAGRNVPNPQPDIDIDFQILSGSSARSAVCVQSSCFFYDAWY